MCCTRFLVLSLFTYASPGVILPMAAAPATPAGALLAGLADVAGLAAVAVVPSRLAILGCCSRGSIRSNLRIQDQLLQLVTHSCSPAS